MAQAREKRLIELLQGDLRNLSNETKRKYPPVKEAAESAILKIRTVKATPGETPEKTTFLPALQQSCGDLLQPFLMGCDTKSLPVIQLCFTSMQRLINHDIIDPAMSVNIVNRLWQIYDQNVEELQLRILQTALVLLTSKRSSVTGDVLAKALVLCFRLHFTKNEVTNHTAEATIRQVVALVFDRVLFEDETNHVKDWCGDDYIPKSSAKYLPPENLSQTVKDAYMLFQDLCQLVNADSPFWLNGITEMTRTFGLELVETVLAGYDSIFCKHPEFKFLLKDRVCALVIRLFSPNIKHRQGAPPPPSSASPTSQEKPFFPISMRLLRVVSILLKKYYTSLITESEIFLSLLLKFLDTDKPAWQRVLAIEVLQQLCVQPKLLRSFCCAYDMQTHSNKIYRNLVASLGTFIQNLMASYASNPTNTSVVDILNSSSTGNNGQNLFTPLTLDYKGVSIPLLPVSAVNNGKYLYREMLDKIDPPPVPDGYVLGMAFFAFLDLIKGLTSMVDSEFAEAKKNEGSAGDTFQAPPSKSSMITIYKEMLEATWCGMLTVLSLLLESSVEDATTEAVLKCIESCAAVCGYLENKPARDAFITILCKASLPVHYALPVFNASLACLPQKIAIGTEQQQVLNSSLQQQVVAMGQPLASNSNQVSVMLTAKNIRCMRTILNLAHCHGAVMNTAWQIILTTLQHLVWILGLKPTTLGQLLPNPRSTTDPNSASNTVLTTAVLTDLPVLSSMLSELFESSKNLDDVALHHLINALCSLSLEAMDAAYSSNVKEPSLFAIAKLLETGLVNMFRIEILWRPVSGHLLEVCQHPNAILREWGAEGVTSLVKSAINYKHDTLLSENPRMLHMFLHPLKELSSVSHVDVKQKQLDGTLQMLQSSGDILSSGWPEILHVIGSPTTASDENTIRTGFRSLQLVISDFLPSIPCNSLQQCIDVVTKYGLQMQDFNISLTAIGLLWSVSDYMFQNRLKISENLLKEGANTSDRPMVMDDLWLDLFTKIGKLCVDSRPAVRKSAGQTLFSTISTHGSLLSSDAWNRVVWEVLFVLMDNVQTAANNASCERSKANILMHHSRDTDQKQWQETLVITLAGLSRIFNLKRSVLATLPNFVKAWEKLFAYLEDAALCPSSEVSGAAMCSFEDVLVSDMGMESEDGNTQLWVKAWDTWCSIGVKVTVPPGDGVEDVDNVISQAYLTSYVSLFSTLHKHIQAKFSLRHFHDLARVLEGAIRIPVRWDAAAFELPSLSSFRLTPLQDVIIRSINVVQKGISLQSDTAMYPAIFALLLKNARYATTPPTYGKVTSKKLQNGKYKWQCPNCVPYAEYSIGLAVELYKKTACHKAVIKHGVLNDIVKTLCVPLSKRYDSLAKGTWQFAVDALVHVLQTGMPVVRQYSQSAHFDDLWDNLYLCIEAFLFPSTPQPSDLSAEDHATQENLDMKLVQLIRDEILPQGSCIPKDFVAKIIDLLNRGSAHHREKQNGDIGLNRSRDGLSQACFDTLLQFSLFKNPPPGLSNNKSSSVTSTLATDINDLTLESLIKRCHSSLTAYIDDERLTLHRPLPQSQVNDCMRLLSSTDTLLGSIIEKPNSVDPSIWGLVKTLYPILVNCVSCSSPEFRAKVAKLLLHYKSLIKVEGLS